MNKGDFEFKREVFNSLDTAMDFPIKGVLFRDVTPLLQNFQLMEKVLTQFGESLSLGKIDHFAGIESRGFIFASMLATRFGKGFIPIRKAGKLPPPTFQKAYQLEYGEARIEMKPGSGNIVIVDDVLATGGTLNAAIELSGQAGFNVLDAIVLIDLVFLNSFKFQGAQVKSILQIGTEGLLSS